MKNSASMLPQDAEHRLKAFKREVEAALPDQVIEMRLFGSRARGDAEPDSDYDVAIFMRNPERRRDILNILSDIAYPHHLDGYFINAIGLPADYLDAEGGYRTELAAEIARDGVLVS